MIKKLRITVNGKTYDVTVEMADEPGMPAVVRAPEPVQTVASASVSPAAASHHAPAHAHAGPGDVPSPLAGRVTAVIVQAGQAVKEGDHLLTLEAMKMNTFVFAPKAGTVKEVKVAAGAAVEEGQPLVHIE